MFTCNQVANRYVNDSAVAILQMNLGLCPVRALDLLHFQAGGCDQIWAF